MLYMLSIHYGAVPQSGGCAGRQFGANFSMRYAGVDDDAGHVPELPCNGFVVSILCSHHHVALS